MKSRGQINIPSVTIAPTDLKVLVNLLLKKIDQKNQSKIKSKLVLQGRTFKEEYDVSDLPDFNEFHDGLISVELSINVDNTFHASINMNTEEANPLFPVFSKVNVEGQDSTLVAGTIDEIRRFFNKRRNINVIFHSYGIFVAIVIAYLTTFVVYANLCSINLISEIEKTVLYSITAILSFPLKSFFRWTFPYILFKGENPVRDNIRYVLVTLILGIIGNAGYGYVTLNWALFIK